MNLLHLLVKAFQSEDLVIRKNLDFAIAVIDSHRLFRNAPVPPEFLKNAAKMLYEEYAGSHIQLFVLQKALSALYEHYLELQQNIVPPPIFLPVASIEPFWNEAQPKLQISNVIVTAALLGASHSDPNERLISLLLLLSRHSAIDSPEALRTVVGSCENFIILSSEMCVSKTDKKIYFFDGICLFLIKKIRELASFSLTNKAMGKLFKSWLGASRCEISAVGFKDALVAINVMTKPIFSSALGEVGTELPLPNTLYVLTGSHNCVEMEQGTELVQPTRRRKRTFDIEGLSEIANEMEFNCYGFGSSDFDKNAFDILDLTLKQFEKESHKEQRTSSAFKRARRALNNLLNESRLRCSAIAVFSIYYCINIFLYGTPWKARLRISTVIEYASRIQLFIQKCLVDDNLIAQAQESQAALYELTDCVADAVIGITSPSTQNTVLIFLQYLYTRSGVRFFDESRLEYHGAGAMEVRTHYISPALFEQAIARLQETSIKSYSLHTVWFLRICYYLGLRHAEAEYLKCIDISEHCIYVSKDEIRKSHAGYRRVLMSFLPPSLHQSFRNFYQLRQDDGCEFLFESKLINHYLDQALALLKDLSGIDNIVVHSLRHCSANNKLWLMFIAAFERSDLIGKYHFLKSELFSDETLFNLKKDFKTAGRELSITTPVFEIVATSMGHCSPVITATSYLHLLNLLEFEVNPMRQFIPDRNFIASIYGNNYKYEILKSNINSDDGVSFKSLIHGFYNCIKIEPEDLKSNKSESNQASNNFLAFFDRFLSLLESPECIEDGALSRLLTEKQMLERSKSLYKSTVFLKYVQKASLIEMSSVVKNAFKTTLSLLDSERVTDVRTLRQLLKTIFLVSPYKFKLTFFHRSDDTLPILWLQQIDKNGFSSYATLKPGVSNCLSLSFLNSKNERILAFKEIITLFNIYIRFKSDDKSE